MASRLPSSSASLLYLARRRNTGEEPASSSSTGRRACFSPRSVFPATKFPSCYFTRRRLIWRRLSPEAVLWSYCVICWVFVLSFGREITPKLDADKAMASMTMYEAVSTSKNNVTINVKSKPYAAGAHGDDDAAVKGIHPCVAATEASHDCFAEVDMEFLQHRGLLDVSKQELGMFCRNANAGLECLSKYAQTCLPTSDERRAVVQNALSSVNMTFFFMCKSRKVQEEYSRHAECLQLLRDDWKQCEPFARKAEILAYSGSLAFSAKDPLFVSMCCHKKAFLACIGDLAAEKCADYQHYGNGKGNRRARDFIVKFTKTLLRERKDREYCDDIPSKMCVAHSSGVAGSPHHLEVFLVRGAINCLSFFAVTAVTLLTTVLSTFVLSYG